ncbi:hypothetical protein H310_11058 [Aphanomyces invadans]|uniref:Uncharacterized protein n=1 Tax=Aphanomyces invadans TaxID=157072 RepID=A0A024TPS2_9STRA|nr:hypothetical protein H310_11058 [Aphanomyces invadans]ETV95631.1 hypothetical protein H310_11058 [Aphanomyces invadans]|eukprot:XP_008875824.1 hypothetical protein H310_11058 [Aphanomyces invadans]
MVLFEYLTKIPPAQAIGVSIVGALGLTTLTWGTFRYTGEDFGGALPGEPRTTSAEWQAATRDYIIAQKMNPISSYRK